MTIAIVNAPGEWPGEWPGGIVLCTLARRLAKKIPAQKRAMGITCVFIREETDT